MKAILLICSALLFIAILNLSYGYYTLLRIVITLGALLVIYKEYKGDFIIWVFLFGVIAVLFNPIVPIHLGEKGLWVPIDFAAGMLFLIKAFVIKKEKNK